MTPECHAQFLLDPVRLTRAMDAYGVGLMLQQLVSDYPEPLTDPKVSEVYSTWRVLSTCVFIMA